MKHLSEKVDRYIELQSGLLKAFERQNGRLNNDIETLNSIHQTGTIQYDRALWGYHIHGLGVRFINIATLVIVDVAEHVDRKSCFTIHRFKEYCETSDIDLDDEDFQRIAETYQKNLIPVSDL